LSDLAANGDLGQTEMDHDQSEIDALTLALLNETNGSSFRRARKALESRPTPEVVAALIRAMRRATNPKMFDRAAKLLAGYGGDEAANALAAEARSQRQYPRLAVRALARCSHPLVVPTLLELYETGRAKQRRSAAFALARLRSPHAIEPLCRAATRGDRYVGPEALEALRSMGRPRAIARLALAEAEFTSSDIVRVLQRLSESPLREGLLRSVPFDPKRFLESEAEDQRSTTRARAAAAAEHLKMQSTLLRGAGIATSDSLLRAASSSGESAPDSLLRSSDITVTAEVIEARPRPRFEWLFQVCSSLRRRMGIE
jgi:HEAT repeat protein